MKMKRLLSFFIITLIVSSVISMPQKSFAQENKEEKVLFESVPIIDSNVLFERAKSKKNDLPFELANKLSNIQTAVLKGANGKEVNLETLTTSQLLKVKKNNNVEVKSYAITSFGVADNESLISTYSDRTISGSAWDASYSTKAYSTVYYDVYQDGTGLLYYKLISVSGGWNRADTTVSLSGQRVTYGATGPSLSGGAVTQASGNLYPSGYSYNYNAPSSWSPIKTSTPYSVLGTTSWATLSGHGSTWIIKLQAIL